MKLGNYPNKHLTYCSNIHPGETWEEVFEQIKANLPKLKTRLSPDNSFGVGLRLSAQAAEQLLQEDRLSEFSSWLDEHDLYVFTMNGFPYGNFHGEQVKDEVYKPDWTSEKRMRYTQHLAHILTELLPEDMDGGISTSPISYKPWLKNSQLDEVFRLSSRHLAEVAYKLADIREETGKNIHVDIEPEPDCLIENTEETISFFQDWLFKAGAAHLAVDHSYSHDEAVNLLQNHIRVCYDTCHFAVEYEDPEEAITKFREAGIKIGKVQISAALKVAFDGKHTPESIVEELRPFEEDTYLHQVIERQDDGSFHHYPDLGEALRDNITDQTSEWRIHYHVPIFVDQFNKLNSTQDDIAKSLDILLNDEECTHFEIETYTWDVLPSDLKQNLLDSIEREFRWVLDQIN